MASERLVSGLRDELDVLVRSIVDLDAELAAGDISSADYLELKDDYTVRAADLSRKLDRLKRPTPIDDGKEDVDSDDHVKSVKSGVSGAGDDSTNNHDPDKTSSEAIEPVKPTTDSEPSSIGRARWFRPTIVAVAAAVFAVTSGLLLAQFSGERGVNDELTGNIEASTRQQSFECQQLSGSGDIVGALECYDDVLTQDPQNLEAITYRGWLLVLTAASAEQAGNEAQTKELLEGGLTYLDQAVAQDPAFLDARAFRAATYDRQGRGDEACTEVAALLALEPPDFFVQQTAGIIDRNNCN